MKLAAVLLSVMGVAILVRAVTPGDHAVPAADRAEAARDLNAFALDLYARLRGREGNLFLSPASISTALAMTYAGARGQTAEEMAGALHFTLPADRLHPAMGGLLRDLNGDGGKRGYALSVANALWAQRGHPFLPEFLKLVHDDYDAAAREMDFAGAADESRRVINAWVEKQTHDRIKDLLPAGSVNSDTRLVLTNAIYFKGDWAHPFQKSHTHDAPFRLGGGKEVTVRMMGPTTGETAEYGYFEDSTLQALEMPYAGKELSMVVLLPRKVDGLEELEKALTPGRLQEWLGKLREREVSVSLPRFKVTAQFMLNDALAALGMRLAFTSQADFSGMDGRRDLAISAVVHKAFVDVNEKGTEAAAATGVVVKALAEPLRLAFRADHPFLFLIRDRRSGAVLFMGRLTDPRA
jgi:serpin B